MENDEEARGVSSSVSETVLRRIISNIPVAVICRDPSDDFRNTVWNEAAEDLMDITAEEALGKNVYDLFDKDAAELIMALDQQAVEAGEVIDIPEDKAYSHRFGEMWFHTVKVPLTNKAGEPCQLMCVFENITERKKATASLVKTQHQLEGIIESVPDILIRIAQDGTFLSVKCDDPDLLLAPKEDIPGSQIDWSDLSEDVVVKTRDALKKVLADKGPQSYQYTHEVPKGVRTFDCRMVRTGKEEAVIFIRDITASRNYIDSISEALAKAEFQSARQFEELTAMRSGLTKLEDVLESFAESSDTPAVKEQADAMRSMIEHLLTRPGVSLPGSSG